LLATIGAISAVFANCIGSVDGFLFPSVISNPAAVHVRRVVNFPRAITVNKAEKNSVEKQMFAASFWLLDIGYWLLVISYQKIGHARCRIFSNNVALVYVVDVQRPM